MNPHTWREGTIHTLVVDDIELFRRRVVVALEAGDDLDVTEVDGLPAAGRAAATVPVDVAVVATSALAGEPANVRRAVPGARVVLLAAADDEVSVEWVRAAGALAVVPRDRALSEVLAVVRRVAAGEACVPADVAGQLAEARSGADLGVVTERERRILQVLATGVEPAAVAEGLDLAASVMGLEVADALRRERGAG